MDGYGDGYGGAYPGYDLEPSQQIMVRNLPWSTANEGLVELFETTGQVELAEILFEGTRSKGCGVVQFSQIQEAETAIAKFQHYIYGGRPLAGLLQTSASKNKAEDEERLAQIKRDIKDKTSLRRTLRLQRYSEYLAMERLRTPQDSHQGLFHKSRQCQHRRQPQPFFIREGKHTPALPTLQEIQVEAHRLGLHQPVNPPNVYPRIRRGRAASPATIHNTTESTLQVKYKGMCVTSSFLPRL